MSRERLPEGFTITRYYWDVEPGGPELDRRSQSGTWRRFTDAGIPRDGGTAELRAALRDGKAPFAAVIWENIERTGRDFPDAIRLEPSLTPPACSSWPPTSRSTPPPPTMPRASCAA
jgi:hypothetical protein